MIDHYIVVRDRRQPRQFSICNVVIDEWYPIIGPIGYSLYSLYVRMARIDDERCWPGYTLIGQHLGIGRSSISEYNRLLCWCGLIYIEEGDRNHSNNYYILDVPEVTAGTMQHLLQEATVALSPGSELLATLKRRLDTWEPIQALWGRTSRRIEVIRPGQMILPGLDEGSPVPEHPSPVPEHPVRVQDCNNPKEQSKPTIQRDNPQQQEAARVSEDDVVVEALLAEAGIAEPMRSKLAQCVDRYTARAWILYAETQELASPPGFLVSVLRDRRKPPAEFVRLAQIGPRAWAWLEKHAPARDLTGTWAGDRPVDEEVAETWYEMYYREMVE